MTNTAGGLALEIILMLLAVLIVIVVLLQGGKAQGLGSTLTGERDSNLFQVVKESEPETKATILTFSLIATFICVAFLTLILVHFGLVKL